MRRPRRFVAFAGAATLLAGTVAATVGGATVFGATVLTPTPAAAATLAQPTADILVDAATGHVLIGDNVHKAVHPASTAKIMTALTAVERMCPGATVTANAQDAGVETMRIGLPVAKPWPIDQIMASMIMVSANDAAYALADTVGGGLDGFAKDLAATARQLGLRDSTLGDPAGLDDNTSYKGGAYMSAYDLAIATRNALTVPDITKWTSAHEYSFTDPTGAQHHLVNHNKMLPGGGAAYPGATGFKTGFTNRSQHTLVATANRNGRTLIAVILGAPDSGYAEAGSLLDAGFAMPADAKGTGETLPAVKVTRCADRRADQAAFAKLGTANLTSTQPVVTVPRSIPSLSQAPLAPPAAQARRAPPRPARPHTSRPGS